MGVLHGKLAVITGGASGLGLAIARAYAAEGARIGIIDRRPDLATAMREMLGDAGAGWSLASADVGHEAAVEAAFAHIESELGPTAILVNCAGIDSVANLEDTSLEAWETMLRVHLTGTFLCCRRVLPGMRTAGWGRIINMSSQLGHRGAPGMVPYCAAKAGILGLTRALSYEVIGDGITVNCLAPGPIDTPLVASLPKEVVAAIVAQVPAGRIGTPEEVAVAALMLAREDAGYFVGASLNMNGGHYMI